jgi:HTH-type transcriptional regulator / antitoxin HigA
MSEKMAAELFPPGEFLKDELDARGWTQTEFAEIIGRPQRLVNELIMAKRAVTPATAMELAAALGTSAQFWMNLESAFQLSKVAPKTERISREAALRGRFPVREMMKRGWIMPTKVYDELESAVFAFFGISQVDDSIRLPGAAWRKYEAALSTMQWAWLLRVNQLASALQVAPYSEKKLRASVPELEQLMTEPEEARHVPRILAECGVRLVVVEPIPGSKVDGVCFWIKGGKSPVVGLSLKGDHIDKFWFNLWHEIEHVLRGDGKETPVVDDFDAPPPDEESERAANSSAANHCVPIAQMDDFVARHNPMFSEKSLIGFSRLMKRHPGIVAGQIQKRTGRWDLFKKKHQPRIREIVIQSALTDGYGRSGPTDL